MLCAPHVWRVCAALPETQLRSCEFKSEFRTYYAGKYNLPFSHFTQDVIKMFTDVDRKVKKKNNNNNRKTDFCVIFLLRCSFSNCFDALVRLVLPKYVYSYGFFSKMMHFLLCKMGTILLLIVAITDARHSHRPAGDAHMRDRIPNTLCSCYGFPLVKNIWFRFKFSIL